MRRCILIVALLAAAIPAGAELQKSPPEITRAEFDAITCSDGGFYDGQTRAITDASSTACPVTGSGTSTAVCTCVDGTWVDTVSQDDQTAPEVPYTPTTAGDWSAVPAEVGAGLDTLAGDLAGLPPFDLTGILTNGLLRWNGTTLVASPILFDDGSKLIVRQSGGVAGTDEVQIYHDGTDARLHAASGELRIEATLGSTRTIDLDADGPEIHLRGAGNNAALLLELVDGSGDVAFVRWLAGSNGWQLMYVDDTDTLELRRQPGNLARLRVSSAGTFTFQPNGTNPQLTVSDTADEAVLITPAGATQVPLVTQGVAGQTAPLQEWQDSTGAAKVSVSDSTHGTLTLGDAPGRGRIQVGGALTSPNLSQYLASFYGNSGSQAGIEMRNLSNGTGAEFRFVLSDHTGSDSLTVSMPSDANTGTLFGVTRGTIASIFTSGSSDPRHLALGTFAARDLILGTSNTERARILSGGGAVFQDRIQPGPSSATCSVATEGSIRVTAAVAGVSATIFERCEGDAADPIVYSWTAF